MHKNLVLDLDGTLLFGEYSPGALVIKGRRRDSYLAAETLTMLYTMQSAYQIFLATGRSLQSAKHIFDILAGEDVYISGIVAENGGVWVDQEDKIHFLPNKSWLEATNNALSVVGDVAQKEFVTCLALLSPRPEDIQQAISVYSELNLKFNLLKDGNKLFILAGNIHKKNALIYGLGHQELKNTVGAGNDINDIEWLKAIAFPACTSCSKEEVKTIVSEKNGLVTQEKSHAGIQEILRVFEKL